MESFSARNRRGVDLSPETLRRLSEAFVDNLAEIHAIDYEAAGLGELGSPQGYVSRQIDGWTKRYYNARARRAGSRTARDVAARTSSCRQRARFADS